MRLKKTLALSLALSMTSAGFPLSALAQGPRALAGRARAGTPPLALTFPVFPSLPASSPALGRSPAVAASLPIGVPAAGAGAASAVVGARPALPVTGAASAAAAFPASGAATAAAEPAAASEDLERAAAAGSPEESGTLLQQRQASEGFWSGSSKPAASAEEVDFSAAGQAPARLNRPTRAARAAGSLMMGAAAVPESTLKNAAALPQGAGQALSHYGPYLEGVAILAGTYAVNRLVRWSILKASQRGGWDANKTVVARLLASTATWALGVGVALAAAGVSGATLAASLGIGGIAVTMSAKEFIGNLLEAVKVLMTHPFKVGDTIMIGDKVYRVRGLSLRYLELDRYEKSSTLMTYSQLSSKSITIAAAYEPTTRLSVSKARLGFKGVVAVVGQTARVNLFKATMWAGVGIAMLSGLPVLKANLVSSFFVKLFPWLQAGAILFMTRQAARWITAIMERISEKADWNPQTTAVAKLAAQAAAYVLGGTILLYTLGVTWTALLASFGATSIAVGWAASDVISNVIQGFWILFSRPFKMGDALEVGGVTGRVIDMNMQYVVLEHSNKSHTLIPYSVIRDSAFTVLDPEEADTSAPKPNADANLPPSKRDHNK